MSSVIVENSSDFTKDLFKELAENVSDCVKELGEEGLFSEPDRFCKEFGAFLDDWLINNFEFISEVLSSSDLQSTYDFDWEDLKFCINFYKPSFWTAVRESLPNLPGSLRIRLLGILSNAIERLELWNPSLDEDTETNTVDIKEQVIKSQLPEPQAPESSTEPSYELVEAEGEKQGKQEQRRLKKSERFWNHLTISRDQTSRSNYKKDILLILRPSTLEMSKERQNMGGPRNEAITLPSDKQESFDNRQQYDKMFQQQALETLKIQEARMNMVKQRAAKENPATNLKSEPASITVAPQLSRLSIVHSGNSLETQDKKEFEIDFDSMAGIDSGQGLKGLNFEAGPSTSPIEADPSPHHTLEERFKELESEYNMLKQHLGGNPRFETLYFLLRDGTAEYSAYHDEPEWIVGPDGGGVLLTSHFPITDVEGYLRQRLDIAFVIGKFYARGYQDNEVERAQRDKQILPRPKPAVEGIHLQSKDMIEAMEEFLGRQENFDRQFPNFLIRGLIGAPYLFCMIKLLTDWINENYGSLYDRIEGHLIRRVVTNETMPFLVRPGDVIVMKDKRSIRAAVSASWPVETNSGFRSKRPGQEERKWTSGSQVTDDITSFTWSVNCWSFRYDGQFYRHDETVEILLHPPNLKGEVDIQDLDVYPLRFGSDNVKETLGTRGETFWSCRHRKLVAYQDEHGIYGSSDRFMVDFHTYHQIHSEDEAFQLSYKSITDPKCEHMDSSIMEMDEPPKDPEIYVFPLTTIGFNLRSKKWVDLEVDRIKNVQWNTQSFHHLVIDEDTKVLIQALVTNQIEREQSTDIIQGKGNGLIILLHGGPGTGKTFTAESVAEIAEKPFYRVTCGDIGTKPEDVEKYLESALHLGNSWGCVVLLDEADVFLEQRTLSDLDRNALVSVFLRVLEYYEGILILTSNRVGTFDEAFKSRIQLSLPYPNLTKGQRTKIWRNFLDRLKSLDQNSSSQNSESSTSANDKILGSMNIDFSDVECYFSELADYEMNGRQIRNAITTARQLAKFKEQPMAYQHLKHVIEVSSKFDKYLKKVQDGLSDDQIARGEGIR